MRISVAAIPVAVLLWGTETHAQAPAPAPEPAPPSEATTEVVAPQPAAPATAAPQPAASDPAAAGAQPSPAPSEGPAPAATVAPVPASSVDRQAIAHAITELEQEKDQTASLGAPITVLAVGGGTCVVSAYLVLYGWGQNQIEQITGDTSNVDTALFVLGGVGLVAGAGMAIGGGLWLRSRLDKRRPLNRQIEELEHQLEAPVATVRVTPTLGRGTYGLGLSGAF